MFRMAALLALGILIPSQGFGQRKPTRYDVEAAYLYQFGNFVQWPATKAGTGKRFSICVLGRDPFGRALDQIIQGGKVNGATLTDRRIDDLRQAGGCQILFVSASEEDEVDRDLKALSDTPVLTVSDIPDFARRGGMIQFVLVGDRVRFDVNVSNADRAGLKLSSQLLKVALDVRGGQNPKK